MKYNIRNGDILLTAKGSNNQVSVLLNAIGAVVASFQFVIIKPISTKVQPYFIAWFINQAFKRGYFKQVQEGTFIPFVSKSTLTEMTLPIPSIEDQRRIVRLYKLQLREKELMGKLLNKRNELITGIINKQLNRYK